MELLCKCGHSVIMNVSEIDEYLAKENAKQCLCAKCYYDSIGEEIPTNSRGKKPIMVMVTECGYMDKER